MKHPDMILRIDRDADGRSDYPRVRQRFRPHRVYLEDRGLGGPLGRLNRRSREQRLPQHQRREKDEKRDEAI